MAENFWSKKKVLVTGIAGFVGSWLADALLNRGAEVYGIERDLAAVSNYKILDLDSRTTIVNGDLADFALVERALNEYEIDTVYHLAAQAIVSAANRSPLSTFESNIKGSWNILEACRATDGVRRIIFASSDKSYGVHDRLPYKEDFPLQPRYPYDVSKACADLLARCYFYTYDLPIAITRFANIYGGGDLNFSRIIPDTIRSIIRGKNPIIRSDGTPERDFLYIKDAVKIYLMLAEALEQENVSGEVFNAGSGAPISMKALVEQIIAVSGTTVTPEIIGKGTPHGEIDRQFMDAVKAGEVFGYKVDYTLEKGLKETYQWYETHADVCGITGT